MTLCSKSDRRPDKSVFPYLIKIICEIRIYTRRTFRSLHNNEAKRTTVDKCIGPKAVPVNFSLIVRDVYSMNLIALRIFGISIKCSPSEACRSHKKIIERPDIKSDDQQTTNDQSFLLPFLRKGKKERPPIRCTRLTCLVLRDDVVLRRRVGFLLFIICMFKSE